jgi:hypothetical protein
MNANYAVWSDSQGVNAQVYDLNANQLRVAPNCAAPILDDAGPYMVCDTIGNSTTLAHLPDGAQVNLPPNSVIGYLVSFFNGQGYFVDSSGNVERFDLPAE